MKPALTLRLRGLQIASCNQQVALQTLNKKLAEKNQDNVDDKATSNYYIIIAGLSY